MSRRGFTLVELLITIVISVIIGGVAVTALWLFLGTYTQSNEYAVAREELEFAYQMMGKEITNIAHGLPNNKSDENDKKGDFSESFKGNPTINSHPVMYYMGELGEPWGGPILLLKSGDKVEDTDDLDDDTEVYAGNEIYYTWSMPVTIKKGTETVNLKVSEQHDGTFTSGFPGKTFTLLQDDGVDYLVNYKFRGEDAGVLLGDTSQRNPRSWVTFPGLHVPMLVTNLNSAANTITLAMAPYSSMSFTGFLAGLEDVCIIRTSHVYVNERHELIHELVFDGSYDGSSYTPTSVSRMVLANNVVGACFTFDRKGRALTAYLAIKCDERNSKAATGAQPIGWPNLADFRLDPDDLNYRIVMESRTWRIRN